MRRDTQAVRRIAAQPGRTKLEWPLAAGKATRARDVKADIVASWVCSTVTQVQVCELS